MTHPRSTFARTQTKRRRATGAARTALAASFLAAGLLAAQEGAEAPPNPDPLARFDLTDPAADWRLPGRLEEISGLALSPDGRLFAHDDERAVIYEVDLVGEELVKAFAMGDRVARDDFEGIAIVGDVFYLVSSDGRLYESGEGEDDERLLYNTYGTGVGRRCEVEGLAHYAAEGSLLVLCKTPRDERLNDVVAIFRWSLATRAPPSTPLAVDMAAIERATDQNGFAASGIAVDPVTGNYVLISSADRAIVSVTPDGTVLGGVRLDEDLHPQPEGVEFDTEGRLLIADEARAGRARITAYAPRPAGG